MTPPLITISIVSHGDAQKISHLLASLQKHEQNTASRFQLILTDNLKDNLPDVDPNPWESFHMLRNQHPLGFAENHNRAFELARGTYFAILNPDLIFESPVFEALLSNLQEHNADLIAPKIVDETGTPQDSFRPLPTPIELIQRRMPGHTFRPPLPDADGIIRPDWIAGMFWLLRSETYRQLGGMDKNYRLYFEDVEFCTRARLQGMKLIVDSNLQVQHHAQRSSRVKLYYLVLHLCSAFRFFTSSSYHKIRNKH